MITEHNLAELDALIRQFFKIEDITYGSPKQPFVVRYRGTLITNDSPSGFDRIAEALQPHKLVPLLRFEDGSQVLFLMPEPEAKGKLNPRLNVVLISPDPDQCACDWRFIQYSNRTARQYLASISRLDKERMAVRCITAGDPWHT